MKSLVVASYYWLSWVILVGCIICTPISMLTWAKNEPQTVLVLSWAAMIVGAMGNLVASEIRKVQYDKKEE